MFTNFPIIFYFNIRGFWQNIYFLFELLFRADNSTRFPSEILSQVLFWCFGFFFLFKLPIEYSVTMYAGAGGENALGEEGELRWRAGWTDLSSARYLMRNIPFNLVWKGAREEKRYERPQSRSVGDGRIKRRALVHQRGYILVSSPCRRRRRRLLRREWLLGDPRIEPSKPLTKFSSSLFFYRLSVENRLSKKRDCMG